jgi:hypothetical protein
MIIFVLLAAVPNGELTLGPVLKYLAFIPGESSYFYAWKLSGPQVL